MAAEIVKVEVIHREKIKPSSPTPHHLRNHKLCLLDQAAPPVYTPLLLFYPNFANNVLVLDDHQSANNTIVGKTQHLKKTLSQILTHFYPLAGKITSLSTGSMECNDDGVEFVEARINSPLSKILKKPDPEFLKQFLAVEVICQEARVGPLLLVQVTFFQCGGMVIGSSFSHCVMDATSMAIFINSWAAMALGSGSDVMLPDLKAQSFLPPANFSNNKHLLDLSELAKFLSRKCVTRRFVFEVAKIASLRRKTASESVKNPTRVEAVSALIWKSAMEASRAKGDNKCLTLSSVYFLTMNIRSRTMPPLPENLVGNFATCFPSKMEQDIRENIDMKILVTMLRKGIEQEKEKYGKRALDLGLMSQDLMENRRKQIENAGLLGSYGCTSWCRFPFYNANFGWGKPAWASLVGAEVKNWITLMDTRDGDGIEAWMSFDEDEMALIECNDDMIAFATLNPSVI